MEKLQAYLKRNEYWFAPLAVTLILALPMLIWLWLDNSLPHWDMGRHLYNSLHYGREWYDFIAGNSSLKHLLTVYYYYPPFLYQPTLIFNLFFGVSQKIAVFSNLFWIYIAVFSLYHIATILWNRKTALISIVVLFSMPMVIGMTHEYQADLPLMAWVLLATYMMLRLRDEISTKKALWLGAVLGSGMLIKWTFLFFALPLVIATLAYLVSTKKFPAKRLLSAVLTVSAVAFAISSIWYLSNKASIRADFLANGIEAAKREGDPTGFNVSALKYYLNALGSIYTLVPMGILFLVGAVASIVKIQFRLKNLLSLALIAIFYLLFSILPNKDFRYLMPVMGFVALIIASIYNLGAKWHKPVVIGVLLIFVLNNLSVSFGLTGGRDIMAGNLVLLKGSGYTSRAPRAEVCPMDKIVRTIPYDASARLIGNNPVEFNNWALSYNLEKAGRRWAGEGESASDSDYWIVRLDGSLESKMTLFAYQDQSRVVADFDCRDHSLVIILKNAEKGNVYLPTY